MDTITNNQLTFISLSYRENKYHVNLYREKANFAYEIQTGIKLKDFMYIRYDTPFIYAGSYKDLTKPYSYCHSYSDSYKCQCFAEFKEITDIDADECMELKKNTYNNSGTQTGFEGRMRNCIDTCTGSACPSTEPKNPETLMNASQISLQEYYIAKSENRINTIGETAQSTKCLLCKPGFV